MDKLRNGFPVIPIENRKKILLLSDDLRYPTGVGVMSKEIIYGTCHHFNWIQVGGLQVHPDNKKIFDLSEEVKKDTGIDASVKLYAVTGYGDQQLVRYMINVEKIDAILHFTDPRFWSWLYQMQGELKTKLPLCYYSLWDNTPVPTYNRDNYLCSNLIMSINRQSHAMLRSMLRDDFIESDEVTEKTDQIILDYVPHGIDANKFNILMDVSSEVIEMRSKITNNLPADFVLLYNNRNIRRKMTSDVILSFVDFCDMLPEEYSSRCHLVLHTKGYDEAGTDLYTLIEDLATGYNITIYENKLTDKELNILYNASDATINIACNEGFGLSSTESIMAGTMVINNVTGGLQDHMRFEDNNGKWITEDEDYMTNHNRRYKKCGKWAIPVFPVSRSLSGSVRTPYIFEDRCDWQDVSSAIMKVYKMTPEERKSRALMGRDWLLSDEANMSSNGMNRLIMKNIDRVLQYWTPKDPFELINTDDFMQLKVEPGILRKE